MSITGAQSHKASINRISCVLYSLPKHNKKIITIINGF